jgi:nucleoprotein TPR
LVEAADAEKRASEALAARLQAGLTEAQQRLELAQAEHGERLRQLVQELQEARLSALDAEKESIRHEIRADGLRTQLGENRERLQISEGEVTALRQRLAETETARQVSLLSATQVQTQLELAEQRIGDERSRRSDEVARLEAEVSRHHERATTLAEQSLKLQLSLNEAEKTCQTVQSKLESECVGLRLQLEQTDKKYRETAEQHALAKQRLESTDNEIAVLRQQIADQAVQHQLSLASAAQLQCQITQAEQRIAEEQRDQREKVARLEAELETYKVRAATLSDRCVTLRQSLDEATNDRATLQAENDALQTSLQDAISKYRESGERCDEKQIY